MKPLRLRQPSRDSRLLHNQPTLSADSPSEEVVGGDTDEPPDKDSHAIMKQEQQFQKISVRGQEQRKQSLLTQNLHSSASESDSSHHDEDVFSPSTRAHSSASNWSRGSLASTADLTSDGHTSPNRTRSPSPPSPKIRLPTSSPIFNTKSFGNPATVKIIENGIGSLRTSVLLSANEETVEAGLGRKRCIMFACGKKNEAKKEEAIKVTESRPMLPARRPCALTFACPTRTLSPTNTNKPHIKIESPAPAKRMPTSPKQPLRSHRGSDVTIRTTSPRTARKPSVVRARRSSAASKADPYEATRFHEFASSEEERDDWVQEQTCHRSRLTIDDTLKVENTLRNLGKEVEEEVLEEDEEEELDQGLGNEEEDVDEDDEDDDNDSIGMVDSTGYLTDEGFQTDNEEGFAGSDDDSDTGSEFAWWVPSNSGGDHVEHIRPSRPRSGSGSSIGSFSSTRVCPAKSATIHHRRKKTTPVDFRPRTPELPDSTDFVCGTLDEDRPLEHAYYSCLQQRRAAKHVPIPQDIDPTFPTSDPGMDEEDEDSDENDFLVDESDHHMFMHGAPDASDSDNREPRGIVSRKRSPNHSPKRLRSPPPARRGAYHHSPPPRRLRSPLPASRHRSPPPAMRHRSPPVIRLRSPPAAGLHLPAPVVRRASFLKHMEDMNSTPIALHGPPKSGRLGTNSLPRNGAFARTRPTIENMAMYDEDCEDDDLATDIMLPRRAAIDIVKGLEKKRQRRKEKLDEKDRRMRAKGNQKKHAHHVLPGRGAARMREMGVELAALRGKRPVGSPTEQGQHILSY